MLGLIKSDFKKLFKGKSLIICCIIGCALSAFTAFILYQTYLNYESYIMFLESYGDMLGDSDLSAEITNAFFYGSNAMSIINIILSDSSVEIFIAICVCIYISSEYSMGTFKNTVSRGFSKNQVYFSKMLVSAVTAIILALFYIGGGIITALCIAEFGEDFNVLQIICEAAVYLLLSVGLAMLFSMAAIIIRSNISIAVCIAAPVIVNLVYTMLMGTVENIDDYFGFWLPNAFEFVSSSYSDGTLWLTALTGTAYIVIAYLIGTFAFSKRDLK